MQIEDYRSIIIPFINQFRRSHGLEPGIPVVHVMPFTILKIIKLYEERQKSHDKRSFRNFYAGSIFPLKVEGAQVASLTAWFDTFFSRVGILESYKRVWLVKIFQYFEPRVISYGRSKQIISGRKQLTPLFFENLKSYADKHNFTVILSKESVEFQGHRIAFRHEPYDGGIDGSKFIYL